MSTAIGFIISFFKGILNNIIKKKVIEIYIYLGNKKINALLLNLLKKLQKIKLLLKILKPIISKGLIL
jgi:hypothetical protein